MENWACQVLRKDFDYFKFGIIPSVQPTHATSSIGHGRQIGKRKFKMPMHIKNYQKSRNDSSNWFPCGSESDAYFHAAVAENSKEYPKVVFNGKCFNKSRNQEEWHLAAYSNFEEKKRKFEVGKWADFCMTDLWKWKKIK
jgi:hypothetical protein